MKYGQDFNKASLLCTEIAWLYSCFAINRMLCATEVILDVVNDSGMEASRFPKASILPLSSGRKATFEQISLPYAEKERSLLGRRAAYSRAT